MNRLTSLGRFLRATEGSALLELAISLPLLVVFIVGIYDFSGAFNQKQKIEHAAQEGAILAGAQPTSDVETANLRAVATVIFNSLVADAVVPQSTCTAVGAPTQPGPLLWEYKISCGSDNLIIDINRAWVPPSAPGVTTSVVGTQVKVTYPYHWHFSSAIQLLFPGSTSYSATTPLSETAGVHNQM